MRYVHDSALKEGGVVVNVTESLVGAKDAAVAERPESRIERAVADLNTHISEQLTLRPAGSSGGSPWVGGIDIAVVSR